MRRKSLNRRLKNRYTRVARPNVRVWKMQAGTEVLLPIVDGGSPSAAAELSAEQRHQCADEEIKDALASIHANSRDGPKCTREKRKTMREHASFIPIGQQAELKLDVPYLLSELRHQGMPAWDASVAQVRDTPEERKSNVSRSWLACHNPGRRWE